jgi:hypothetical protein
MEASQGTGAQNLLVNLIGLTVFGALFYYDNAAGQQRIEQRQRVREAQIAFGDREVFVNDQGEKMSRLKEVFTGASFVAWWHTSVHGCHVQLSTAMMLHSAAQANERYVHTCLQTSKSGWYADTLHVAGEGAIEGILPAAI